MHRLAELTERQRRRAGWSLLVVGLVALTLGVWWVHYSGFPAVTVVDGKETPVVVDYFNWVPRGWLPKVIGYLVAFGGSQMMIGGAAIRFVLGQKMTWSRAAFAAFIAFLELVLIFGIVPSEWLNLSQTDLAWGPQQIAFTIPAWLVLGNEVQLSLAALKDAISGAYNVGMLVAAAVFAYHLQNINKPRPAAKEKEEAKLSPYGRPLKRGEA